MKVIIIVFLLGIVSLSFLSALGESEPVAEQQIEEFNLDGITPDSEGYRMIDAEQLERVLKNKDFILINVHIPYQGEIPGTDANIPFTDIEILADQYPDKTIPIILYCRSGSMSRSTSRELINMGYSNIFDMKGGTNAWISAGGDLDKK